MNILALDVGGTWIRIARCTLDGKNLCMGKILKQRAPWRSGDYADAQRVLSHLTSVISRALQDFPDAACIGISFGGCINHHTGTVLAAAPICGSKRIDLPLESQLRAAFPACEIRVLNDVSALCFGHLHNDGRNSGLIAALTISSGVALRCIDSDSRSIICDSQLGIQGEVGHMPAFYDPRSSWLLNQSTNCDCGQPGHLAAFLSGNGIGTQLTQLLASGRQYEASPTLADFSRHGVVLQAIRSGLECGDKLAFSLLQALEFQAAHLLGYVLAVMPTLDAIHVSGGVIEHLPELEAGVFQVLKRDAYLYPLDFYRQRIRFSSQADNTALAGAALYATSQIIRPSQGCET